MAEKDLRKMRRPELLQAALQQVEELEAANVKIAELETRITELEDKLKDKTIALENCGSIADAAMVVNGVFEKAQQAADQYMESVHALTGKAEAEAEEILTKARQDAEAIAGEAESRAAKAREDAENAMDLVKGELDDRAKALDGRESALNQARQELSEKEKSMHKYFEDKEKMLKDILKRIQAMQGELK